MSALSKTKLAVRIVDFLARHEGVSCKPFATDQTGETGRVLLDAGNRRSMLANAEAVDALAKAGLLHCQGSKIHLTAVGKARARRARAIADGAADRGFTAQHRSIRKDRAKVDGETSDVTVNDNESPLAKLRLRKMTNDEPWIDDAAYAAGERLRLDFTRAHLMQKVTSSWDPTAGSRLKGNAGGKVELGHSALDARARLEAVRRHLGDDLCGVALDVCCYLKGLQTVEAERHWPPRSAKLMLRTALGILADHYGTRAGNPPL